MRRAMRPRWVAGNGSLSALATFLNSHRSVRLCQVEIVFPLTWRWLRPWFLRLSWATQRVNLACGDTTNVFHIGLAREASPPWAILLHRFADDGGVRARDY